MAIAVDVLWSSFLRSLGVLALASLSAVALLGFVFYPWRPLTEHHRAMVALLDQLVTSQGDALVFNSLDYAGYYQALSKEPRPWYYVLTPGSEFLPYLTGDVEEKTRQMLKKAQQREHRALWLVLRGGITPETQPLYEGE